ncbi:MAG: SRPBCC family protein, partial [Candidatus Nitrosotenuis sp.]
VGWKDGEYLSYIATSGLPLDGYHATISISQKIMSSQVKWESFLISQDSEKKKFSEFLEFMDSFYFKSLERLKENIEKAN